MFTASHNPARYNGIKLCRASAAPVGMETGLAEIRDLVARGRRPSRPLRPGRSPSRTCSTTTPTTCSRSRRCRARALKVVVDAGNGMAGLTAPAVLGRLDVEVVPLYFELDGTFPNHEANPIEPANLVDLQAQGARDRRRHRPRLRRRRRPLLPGRRARRAGQPEHADGADRRAGAGQGARVRGHPQPDHLARRAGDRHRARRDAGPHPRRPLLHQGDDGRDRRDLRRRALRALLLPRLLACRLRDAGRAARAGRARRDRPAALGGAGAVRPLRRERRDQLRGGRPAGGPRRARAVLGRTAGRRRGPPRRADRRPQPTGGSMSARPTPSRCCASTPRASTRRPWLACATRSSP